MEFWFFSFLVQADLQNVNGKGVKEGEEEAERKRSRIE
jgi:hypothetical protein